MLRSPSLLTLSFPALLLGVAIGSSCDSGGDDEYNDEACGDLISACHEKDDGTVGSPVNDCHSVGHAGEPDACNDRFDECKKICDDAPPAGDGHTGHDDGHTGHTGDDGHSGTDHSGTDHSGTDHSGTDHSGTDHSGSDSGSGSGSGSQSIDVTCDEIATTCHGDNTPLGIECHDIAHDGDEAACQARGAECLAHC